MDTNFNTVIYQLEMLSLVNTAIKKLKAEHPDYEVFTMSLTTDFATVSQKGSRTVSEISTGWQSEYGRDVCPYRRNPDYQSCGL